MILFENVSKTYDNDTHALDDVSLKIDDGEFVFVVGESGAGKSTFLKLIMREEVPTSGRIIVNDYDLTTIKKRKIPYYRRNLGVVFQDFRLIQNMTAYDNVAFVMRAVGSPERLIKERVMYLLSLVDLEHRFDCTPAQLSGGEQQRVGLARALANEAPIIIADEPTGNVDLKKAAEIMDLLMRLSKENKKSVVVVTHALAQVKKYSERVIVLSKGRLLIDEHYKGGSGSQGSRAKAKGNEKQTITVADPNSCRSPLPRSEKKGGEDQ